MKQVRYVLTWTRAKARKQGSTSRCKPHSARAGSVCRSFKIFDVWQGWVSCLGPGIRLDRQMLGRNDGTVSPPPLTSSGPSRRVVRHRSSSLEPLGPRALPDSDQLESSSSDGIEVSESYRASQHSAHHLQQRLNHPRCHPRCGSDCQRFRSRRSIGQHLLHVLES